jgi:SSS family solute:Na+ symporter
MFWRGATPWGGFFGLLFGILAAAVHYVLYKTGVLGYASEMSANFYQAWWAWLTDFVVTIGVSLFTKKKDRESLAGLVYGLSPLGKEKARILLRPEVWGSAALVAALVLNIIFW